MTTLVKGRNSFSSTADRLDVGEGRADQIIQFPVGPSVWPLQTVVP